MPQPDRITGLPPGVRAAALGRRLLAYLVDNLVPGIVLSLTLLVPDDPTAGLTALGLGLTGVWALVVWWMFATRAAGPGMRLVGLQLVGFSDGRPIGWGRFLLRAVVLTALTVSVVGLLVMLVGLLRHPRHQGWHDRAADAVAIKARAVAPRLSARPTPRPVAPTPSAVAAAARQEPQPQPQPSSSSQPSSSPEPVGAGASALGSSALTPAGHDAPADGDAPVEGEPGRDATTARPAVVARADLAPRWSAVLDDGRQLDVRGLVLLGRNPQPSPGEETAELVKVLDDTRTVSKTHLSLEVQEGGLVVVDRGSTNGSTVTTPQGRTRRCTAWSPLEVPDGSVVSMGDHWLTVRQD